MDTLPKAKRRKIAPVPLSKSLGRWSPISHLSGYRREHALVLVGNQLLETGDRSWSWYSDGWQFIPRLEFRWSAGDELGEDWEQDEEFLEDFYGLFKVMEQAHPEHSDSLFPGMKLHLDNWVETDGYSRVRSLEWLLWCSWGFSLEELYLDLAVPSSEVDDFEWSFYVHLCQDLSDHIRFVKPEQRLPKAADALSEAGVECALPHWLLAH
jgi:hypothetical protein